MAVSLVGSRTVSPFQPLPLLHRSCSTDDVAETWRFFVPIFLHVGIVHFLLNMVAQVYAGGQIEREMGESAFHAPIVRTRLMDGHRHGSLPDRLLCRWTVWQHSRRQLLPSGNPISGRLGCARSCGKSLTCVLESQTWGLTELECLCSCRLGSALEI